MPGPRWLDDDEQRLWRDFLQMYGSLTSSIERQLQRDASMSAADYQVLVALSEAPGQQLRAGELGRCLGWERSRLSHQVRRMSNRGLVRKRECGSDARGTFVELTPSGRKEIEKAAPGHVEHVRASFFDVLSARELASLQRIARKVSAAIAAEESGDDAGVVRHTAHRA